MSYRDTATALAQRVPGNFVGVVLYVPMGGQSTAPWWDVQTFPRASALEEWYEEIAPSHPLFYYIAAFDKTRDVLPVGESVAPLKPGQPGFNIHVISAWRYSPYKKITAVSGDPGEGRFGGAAGLAKTIGLFALFALPVGILLSKMQERKQVQVEKAAFRRIGMDWEQRAR